MRVVLGVTGCIAAYKATEIVRRLKDHGHDVIVVPTAAALKFVGKATWEALSGNRVDNDVFQQVEQVRHVKLAESADLVLVAPATADFLARTASGRADDLLSTVLLTATCPIVLCPAMHTQMWQNPATQANVQTLRERGIMVKNPASGRLTGPGSGPGRFPEPAEIIDFALAVLEDPELQKASASQDLAGKKFAISAGGTREQIDPVRYIGNESSGRMGIALAQVAAARGAEVSLVGANITSYLPSAVDYIPVRTTAEMNDAMQSQLDSDVLIMAAAPADFTTQSSDQKIKKTADQGLHLDLVQTQDILRGLVEAKKAGQLVVGFAAETAKDESELLELGTAKRARKGADYLVLNNVSGGEVFGSDRNQVIIIDSSGEVGRATGSKMSVANVIINVIKEGFNN